MSSKAPAPPKTVTEIVMRDPGELIGAEYNPRQISEKQFKELCDSIRRGDFIEPVVINKHPERDNVIVSGHQRCKAALAVGIPEVPTVEVDYDLEREREMNVRMNKNTGTFDFDVLANMFDVEELKDWGFEDVELGDFEGLGGEESEPDITDLSDTLVLEYKVEIQCMSEGHQEEIYTELKERGLECRLLTL